MGEWRITQLYCWISYHQKMYIMKYHDFVSNKQKRTFKNKIFRWRPFVIINSSFDCDDQTHFWAINPRLLRSVVVRAQFNFNDRSFSCNLNPNDNKISIKQTSEALIGNDSMELSLKTYQFINNIIVFFQ